MFNNIIGIIIDTGINLKCHISRLILNYGVKHLVSFCFQYRVSRGNIGNVARRVMCPADVFHKI